MAKFNFMKKDDKKKKKGAGPSDSKGMLAKIFSKGKTSKEK